GDALDAASGGNDRKRLRWVRGLETYARPLRGILRRGRRRRVVGATADEREGVAAALKGIGHVEPRCTRAAMAAVAVVVAELEVRAHDHPLDALDLGARRRAVGGRPVFREEQAPVRVALI